MEYKSTSDAIKALEKLREQYQTCLISGTLDLWDKQFDTCYQFMLNKVKKLCSDVIMANQKSHLYFSIHINNVGNLEFHIYDSDMTTVLYRRNWDISIKRNSYFRCDLWDDTPSNLIICLKSLEEINEAIKKHLKINEKKRPTPVDSDSDTPVF